MAVVFKNNAKTTLASGINSSVTSISVSAGSLLPSLTGSDFFFATIDDGTKNEIVKVTARSSNTLTVVRAQDNTTAQSFSTGAVVELRLTAAILELFSQTGVAITDEIEAYLDANGLTFPDDTQARFGTDNDLIIEHSSSTGNSRIIDNSGILNIQQSSDDGQIRFQCDDGSGGVTTYYQISGTGETNTFFKDIKLGDNVKALFGTGNDLQIYHSSFDTYLTNSTGHLVLQNQANDKDIVLQTDNGSGGTADYLRLVGANTRMLASQHFRIADTKQLQLGDDNDFSANFNGNHTFVTNNTGILYLTQNVDDGVIRIRNDDGSGGVTDYINLHGGTGEVRLSHYGTVKLKTTTNGVDVPSGGLFVGGTEVITSARNLTNIGTISSGALSVTSDTSSFIRNSTDNDLKFTFTTNNASDFAQLVMDGKDGGGEKFLIAYGSTHSSTPNMLALKSNDSSAGAIGFFTNSAERGRFDTVGKLLIGKTSGDTTNTVGHELKPNGIAVHTSDGTGTLFLNRKTSHGNIIELRKDNSAVGVIGTQNWGIGTSSPSEALHVVGNILTSGGVKVGDSSADALHFFGILKQGSGSGTTVMDSSRNLTNIGTISSGAITSSGNATFNGGFNKFTGDVEIEHNPLILDTNPSNTYGVTEALRIDDTGSTSDRQLQIFELLHSGARSHRLTFNTDITSDGSAYTYTQGNYGGSSQIEFANNGGLIFYTVNQQSGGSTTAITPIERFRINEDGDVRFESGNVFYDASANAFNFIDNVKAQFGTGSDLQIFHDGSNSFVKDAGTGFLSLITNGSDIRLVGNAGSDFMAKFNSNGSVQLYHDNSLKLETTSTGIDVTGVAVVDGLTSSGLLTVGSGAGAIKINESFITARSSDNANDINLIANINVFDADDVVIGSTSGQRFNDNIVFRTNGSQALRLDSSQNATFAGTISGTLASSVTATTQSAGDNSTKVATTAYTDTAIANLADSAPSTLNTLNELAAALGDDANFSTTVTNSIATKLPLAGGTMTGDLNMGSQNLINTQNIRNNDIDFIVQDTTDSVTNFIWRDHSASKLYLGTADAKVELRSNLNLQSGHNIQMNGTAVMSSGRALTNITGFSGTSTTNNGYDFNCTDSTADASYTGMVIDHNISGTDTLTADRTHRALYVDQDSSATGGDTNNEHRLYAAQIVSTATGDSDLVYAINSQARAQHSAGTISAVRGLNALGVADTSSTASQVIGVVGTAQKTVGGTVNSLYGVFGKSHILSGNTTTNSMSAFGLYGEVELDSDTTLTNADGVRSVIDRDAGTITNGYLFRGSYEGTRPTNAFGVYITSDVVNYFAGSVSIGHNTPDQNGLNVHMTDAEVVINDTNSTPTLRFRENGTTKSLISTSSGALTLSSGGSTVALTLDTSQNATFAGTISSGAITSTGLTVNGNLLSQTGSTFGHGFVSGSRGFNFESGSSGSVATIRFDSDTMRFWSGGAGGGNERIRINDAATDNGDINFYGAIDLEGVQLRVSGTTVIDGSRNLTNIGTIGSGAITSTGTSTFGTVTSASYKVGASTVIDNSRNLINIASLNMNTGSAAAVPKTFNIANTGSGSGRYIKFGTISSISQDGRSVKITVHSNAGYNASDAQNQETIIRFKTSNNSSNQSGFYGDCQKYDFGNQTGAPSSVLVKQVSTTEFEFYGLFSNFTGASSFYTVEHRHGTWTHDGTDTGTTAPTGTVLTATERVIFTSGSENQSAIIKLGGITHGASTVVLDGSRNLTNIGTVSCGAITSSGNMLVTANSSSNHSFEVKRASDGSQALRVNATGEVVVSNNYLYATGSGVGFYVQNNARFRGNIGNDISGQPLTVADDMSVTGSFDATSAGSIPSIRGGGSYGGGIGFVDTNVSGMYTDSSGANLRLFTNQSGSDRADSRIALTLDSSKNATFGGTISSGAITSSGVVTATSGSGHRFGRLTLRDDSIEEQQTNTDTATVAISYNGYGGGTTKFRDFAIFDGKQQAVARFDGSDKTLNVVSGYQLNGTTVVDSSRNLTNIGTISSGAITTSGSVTAASGSNESQLTNVGSLELTRSAANAFIDFKSSTSEDYDCRIQQSGNGLIFQTGGNGSSATGLTINSSQNATFAGTISSGDITIADGVTPALTLSDTGNAGGGGASGKVIFKNTGGDAMGIGYTNHVTADSDMIISTNAGGTYGGYLGLDANGITDAQSDIILEPKTNVRIATGSIEMGTTVFIDQSRNLTNIGTISSGAITSSGDITAFSDERLKDNIQTLDGKKALQMRGVSFTKDGKQGSGVIAQEIEKIAPELVATADDEQGTKSVAYGNLVGYLIEAIKEQQDQIEYMKSEIKTLKEANNGDK